MALFGRRKQPAIDPSQVSPEEALRRAREGLAETKTFTDAGDRRRKLSPEQRAQMEAVFDKIEAAQARGPAPPPPAPGENDRPGPA